MQKILKLLDVLCACVNATVFFFGLSWEKIGCYWLTTNPLGWV